MSKKLVTVLSLAFLAACGQTTPDPVVEPPQDPVVDPEPEPSGPPTEPPTIEDVEGAWEIFAGSVRAYFRIEAPDDIVVDQVISRTGRPETWGFSDDLPANAADIVGWPVKYFIAPEPGASDLSGDPRFLMFFEWYQVDLGSDVWLARPVLVEPEDNANDGYDIFTAQRFT